MVLATTGAAAGLPFPGFGDGLLDHIQKPSKPQK